MDFEAKIKVNVPDKDYIYNALAPDMEDTRKIKIKMHKNDALEFHIEAGDINSLRAGVNITLQLLKLSCEIIK